MSDNVEQKSLPHHLKHEYCDTRPKYRRGKKRTSVRVFTINLESKFLLVIGIPAIGLEKDLLKLFSAYGTIQEYKELKDYDKEDFTLVYLLKYQDIQAAKTAKRKLDEHYFFGAVLHVCYAPEYETLDDVREKINHRRQSVTSRVKFLEKELKEDKRKKGKKSKNVNSYQSTTKPGSISASSGQKPSTSNEIIASNKIGPSFIPTQPQIKINIPRNKMGIPLTLPPPPPPNMMFPPQYGLQGYSNYPPPPVWPPTQQFNPMQQNVNTNYQNINHFHKNNNLQNMQIVSKTQQRKNISIHPNLQKQHCQPKNNFNCPSTSKQNKLDEPKVKENPKQNVNFNRKPPKFKTKSGYFHQKVLDVLVQKQVIRTPTTPYIAPTKNKDKVPAFLPRKVELKQIDEMNKIELNKDGSIPLMGIFVSGQQSNNEDKLPEN